MLSPVDTLVSYITEFVIGFIGLLFGIDLL